MAIWLGLTLAAAGVTKVAVIGDSISTGAGAEEPRQNGYPVRMGVLLGDSFQVEAFALGGHTLVRKSRGSLMRKPIYQKALEFAPDVAVIMLGTNDSNSGGGNHWQYEADLETDLMAMISDLRQANPDVLVHIAGPPPMYPEKSGLKPDRIANLKERHARLAEIRRRFGVVAAREPKVLIHDLARAFGAEDTTDGVHPTTEGHAKLATHLAEILTIRFNEACDVGKALEDAGVKAKASDFEGYVRHDFTVPGVSCGGIIVAPKQAAAGRPWIWRARFFGHQPGLDLELLDRGWHVAYCDVSNLYGSEQAMLRWDAMHGFMTRSLGCSPKPVLEGMSRGGLPIFNWAARHPERVSAIYGDNPVCDFRTWPGGTGGRRSQGDWTRLLKVYGLDETAAAKHEQVVDRLEPVAKARIPVALVLGMKDDVVPPERNGEAVAARYESLGGEVRVWKKPDAAHHPHGLHPPEELRRFLIEAWKNAE
ncbi:GDSL-type esterase/lipase family protein [Haloferula sp. A504]|uniref:GDSL-type esterase/lipase family protein n=1 Tax=Haloferula sp. A504 TaxID=3373601 RepID=UPI0031C87BD9|nr:GDSL-type esterase/lipase family protein [Verrucomicrobiaceae bacterium E54]